MGPDVGAPRARRHARGGHLRRDRTHGRLGGCRPLRLRETLTISLRLEGLGHPGVAAERLPKALIHRNVPGEGVHAYLSALDREWERAASLSAFGPVQRWIATVEAVRAAGWSVRGGRARWRLGEITVPWDEVRPGAAAAASTPPAAD